MEQLTIWRHRVRWGLAALSLILLFPFATFGSDEDDCKIDPRESIVDPAARRTYENIRAAIVGGKQTPENNLYLRTLRRYPARPSTLDELLGDRNLFLKLKELARHVKTLCPPEKCVAVGLGRSPTAIIAYLQGDVPHYAFNVPLSTRGEKFSLSKANSQALEKHLDHFLPSEKVVNGRSILFIDFASSGESMGRMIPLLSRHLTTRKQSEKFQFAVFADERRKPTGELIYPKEINFFILGKPNSSAFLGRERNDSLLDSMHSKSFNNWSEFDTYKIAKPSEFKPKRRTEFDELVDELSEWKEAFKKSPPTSTYRVLDSAAAVGPSP